MKKMSEMILVVFILLLSLNTVFAVEADEALETEILGNRRVNAMSNAKVAYSDGWFYYSLEENDQYSLCRLNEKTGEKELLWNEHVYGINVSGDWVYGFIKEEENSQTESGIYKIGIDNGSIIKLNSMNPYGMLVIDEWIYFCEDITPGGNKGIYRINTDGGSIETLYPGHVDRFTVYKDQIIGTLGRQLFSINLDGTGFMKFDFGDIDFWYEFTVDNGYIYIEGYGKNPYTGEYESGIFKISLDGKELKLLPHTSSAYSYDVDKDYIYFYVYEDAIYKLKVDGTGLEKLLVSGNIDNICKYEDSIYFNIYIYDETDEIWYKDIETGKENRLSPADNTQYKKASVILDNSIKAMEDIARYDIKMTVNMNEYISEDIIEEKKKILEAAGETTEDLVIETNYTRDTIIKLDKSEGIVYGYSTSNFITEDNTIKRLFRNESPLEDTYYFTDEKELMENKYEYWLTSENISLSEEANKWYHVVGEDAQSIYKTSSKDLFDFYSFIDNGIQYKSKMTVLENQTQYVLKTRGDFGRIMDTLGSNSNWDGFYDNKFNQGILDLEIFINKETYLRKFRTNMILENVIYCHP